MLIVWIGWIVINAVYAVFYSPEELCDMYLVDKPNLVRVITCLFFSPTWFIKGLKVLINWVVK